MKNAEGIYKLNPARSWQPKGTRQRLATELIEQYLSRHRIASLEAIQDHLEVNGLGQILETHGSTALWLARKSRCVIVEAR